MGKSAAASAAAAKSSLPEQPASSAYPGIHTESVEAFLGKHFDRHWRSAEIAAGLGYPDDGDASAKVSQVCNYLHMRGRIRRLELPSRDRRGQRGMPPKYAYCAPLEAQPFAPLRKPFAGNPVIPIRSDMPPQSAHIEHKPKPQKSAQPAVADPAPENTGSVASGSVDGPPSPEGGAGVNIAPEADRAAPAAVPDTGYDWDLLQATQESLREHMNLLREAREELSRAKLRIEELDAALGEQLLSRLPRVSADAQVASMCLLDIALGVVAESEAGAQEFVSQLRERLMEA